MADICEIRSAFNEKILKEAINRYGSNISQTRFLGNYTNLIYEFQRNGEKFILRFSEESLDYINNIMGEIDWVNYLMKNGVSVCSAITSLNNNFVEVIKTGDSYFLVTAFEKAKGKIVDVTNDIEWNEKLFKTWGEMMGKMHALTKEYKVINKLWKRGNWNESCIFDFNLEILCSETIIKEKWRNILTKLSSLPKGKDSYGLVHNDFHNRNFCSYDGKIIVFDFDDCAYNWFACDIAIAIFHALSEIPFYEKQRRKDFVQLFFNSFFSGYSKENSIDNFWIKQIPYFFEYQRIFEFIISLHWDLDKINLNLKEYLNYVRNSIERDIPVIEIVF